MKRPQSWQLPGQRDALLALMLQVHDSIRGVTTSRFITPSLILSLYASVAVAAADI